MLEMQIHVKCKFFRCHRVTTRNPNVSKKRKNKYCTSKIVYGEEKKEYSNESKRNPNSIVFRQNDIHSDHILSVRIYRIL